MHDKQSQIDQADRIIETLREKPYQFDHEIEKVSPNAQTLVRTMARLPPRKPTEGGEKLAHARDYLQTAATVQSNIEHANEMAKLATRLDAASATGRILALVGVLLGVIQVGLAVIEVT